MPNAIEFAAVTKRYGATVAVNGVSAEIPEGQVVGLLGHNGAGKTTLIKLALGLVQPSVGRVQVLDAETGTHAFVRRRARIGYLPEDVGFWDNLTGCEVLGYFAGLKGVPCRGSAALLRQVGLAAVGDRQVRTYSKGMRQRLGIAQALLGSPDLLLLDEPISGLDPQASQEFFELVDELRAEGKTVVISSHLLAELEPHLNRALIVREGRLIAQGTVPEMYDAIGLTPTVIARFRGELNGLLHEPWVAELANPPRLNAPSVVELEVPASRKLDVMRHLVGSSALSDITVLEPSLARLYTAVSAPAVDGAKGNGDE